jgi:BspA type Leucine rich repeat region (6 copies)
MKTKIKNLFIALVWLALPMLGHAQVNYAVSGNTAYVASSPNASGNVVITNIYDGYPVTSIGETAFIICTSLTSVTIPDSVTSIGGSAFQACTNLTSVTILGSVTNFGPDAFLECTSLTNATIGGVTSIGIFAFLYCTSLTSVTIGDSVTSIGPEAFYDTALTSVTIPGSVTYIGEDAFAACTKLTSVTISGSFTSFGDHAFYDCTSLTGVYFQGNSPTPTNDSTVFYGIYNDDPYLPDPDPATVYYLPGTTGWGAMFDGLPTAPWFLPNPVILNGEPSFGVGANGFGFTISWATNASVVVEAATNLANPVWLPVSTNNTLTSGTNYFSDPQWTNYPERFYRVTSAFTVSGTLTGLPAGDTVTLQDNGSDNLTLSNNGTFTFPTALPNGQAYSVTVSGTSEGTSILTAIYPPVTANGSGTISGANVTNVAVQCTLIYTGNIHVDMYNAAVRDGTANGGVPGVMLTQNGGPFRLTAAPLGSYSRNVAQIYSPSAVFTHVVGTTSCSSTTFPSGALVIQFGTVLECGFGPYQY